MKDYQFFSGFLLKMKFDFTKTIYIKQIIDAD